MTMKIADKLESHVGGRSRRRRGGTSYEEATRTGGSESNVLCCDRTFAITKQSQETPGLAADLMFRLQHGKSG